MSDQAAKLVRAGRWRVFINCVSSKRERLIVLLRIPKATADSFYIQHTLASKPKETARDYCGRDPCGRVGVEGVGIEEHISDVGVSRHFPSSKVLVEFRCRLKHSVHVGDTRDVPVANVLVEFPCPLKHTLHVGDA